MLLFAHFIGAAEEHGFTVYDPMFVQQAAYFPSTAGALFCRYPPARRAFPPFPRARWGLLYAVGGTAAVLHQLQERGRDVGLIRLRRDQWLDLNSSAFLDVLAGHPVLFVQDWYFRNGDNCARHRDAIRSFFTPWERHLAAARRATEPARHRERLLVGVHVRRGDYARFKGGRYFFEHRQYAHLMRATQEAFPGREATFLVCSDEPVPLAPFAGLDVLLGPGSEIDDLYSLAACDVLLGPPSTYTTWASYYGEVPRYAVENPSDPVEAVSFVVDRRLGPPRLPDKPVQVTASTASTSNCLR
jgi:hypothetical protein